MHKARALFFALLLACSFSYQLFGAPPSFTSTAYAVQSGPRSIAIGDVNCDGKLDLAVANYNDDSISILQGVGDGTFSTGTNFMSWGLNGVNSAFIAILDLNGDGKKDLAIANVGTSTPGGSIVTFAGNCTPTFGGFPADTKDAGGSPTSLTVDDFNGDGRSDLLVTLGDTNVLSIWLGTGSAFLGGYSSVGTSSTYPVASAVGDFNGDGKKDVAVAYFGSNKVAILKSQGNGSFSFPVSTYPVSQPTSIAVGDFNGDGKMDLAVTAWSLASAMILLGNGDGTFQTGVPYSTGTTPNSIVAGDFNADGKMDLAVANTGSNDVSILSGNGDGTFAAPLNIAVGTYPQFIVVSDFNGDGKRDLAVANGNSNNVTVLLNQSAAGFAKGDVNGDLLVTSSDVFYLLTYLFSNGGSPIGSGDVNGDHVVNGADVFYLINHLFAGGPAPVG